MKDTYPWSRSHTTKIRVGFADTDLMGIVHHSNYIWYFEVARGELLRDCGLSYSEIENLGTYAPVLMAEANYLSPTYYDEELSVQTLIIEVKGCRITFAFRIINSKEQITTKGKVRLAFLNKTNNRPSDLLGQMKELTKNYLCTE